MAVNGEGTELGWLGGGGELLLVDAMRLRQVPRPPPGARRRQPPDLREAKPGREREAERAGGQVLVAHLDLGELDAHPASTPIQLASISTERSNSNSKTLQQQGTAANWGNSQVEAVPEAAEQALVVVLDGLEHALYELPALARVQVRDVHLVGRQLPLLLQAERAGGARDAE